MKKQLLLSTLAVAAIAGSLHADEEKSTEVTRDRDKKEEMSMEDHMRAIDDHLKHLKDDMGYDEEHGSS